MSASPSQWTAASSEIGDQNPSFAHIQQQSEGNGEAYGQDEGNRGYFQADKKAAPTTAASYAGYQTIGRLLSSYPLNPCIFFLSSSSSLYGCALSRSVLLFLVPRPSRDYTHAPLSCAHSIGGFSSSVEMIAGFYAASQSPKMQHQDVMAHTFSDRWQQMPQVHTHSFMRACKFMSTDRMVHIGQMTESGSVQGQQTIGVHVHFCSSPARLPA